MALISYKDFLKIEIFVGTIIAAKKNNSLKNASIILTIDFGEIIGIKKSSAQIQANYDCKNLINKQVVAVINFPPKQIGNLISEVLVLGFNDHNKEPILISPEFKVKDGNRLF
jgi:tRNA-binding protein